MSATNEQIVAEAERRWAREPRDGFVTDYIIQVVREGWTPPPPVDPDLLAVRELLSRAEENEVIRQNYLNGRYDTHSWFPSALAAYKAGREAEAERAKVLVEPAEAIVNRAVRGTGANDLRWPHILKAARRLEEGLNAYKAGKEAAQ
jgi:hypothetical protein